MIVTALAMHLLQRGFSPPETRAAEWVWELKVLLGEEGGWGFRGMLTLKRA